MLIGHVTKLQVQQSSLKIGERRERRYDPAPITTVQSLDVTQGGVVGWGNGTERILDVHHRDHPMSKNRNGDNGISIGFTSHYDLMRQRFGDHLADGQAGENILVLTDQVFTDSDLPRRLLIITAQDQVVELVNIMVAEPCVEFTRFAMQLPETTRPDRQLTDNLEYLRKGMRGYYASFGGDRGQIGSGAQVLIP